MAKKRYSEGRYLTAGQLRKLLEGVPDGAGVFFTGDDLGQWVDRVGAAHLARVADGDIDRLHKKVTKRTNAVVLFRSPDGLPDEEVPDGG